MWEPTVPEDPVRRMRIVDHAACGGLGVGPARGVRQVGLRRVKERGAMKGCQEYDCM